MKYDSYMVYDAYMTVIAWYLWRNDAYTSCKHYVINTWLMLSLKCYYHWYNFIINLIDDNSEDIDVMMILNRKKIIRVVIIACIEHYYINYTGVLSYYYH